MNNIDIAILPSVTGGHQPVKLVDDLAIGYNHSDYIINI